MTLDEFIAICRFVRPSSLYRNRGAALVYRPIGRTNERYPDWIRALRGKSGVYVIRDRGTSETLYVGESHKGKLYETLTRHFQTWRRFKKFWRGEYAEEGHDPGLTYERSAVEVAARTTSAGRAIEEEARLIDRLSPRDNIRGQREEEVPF